MIPKINGPLLWEDAEIKLHFPLRTEGPCPYTDLFPIEEAAPGSEGIHLCFERSAKIPEEGYEIRITTDRIILTSQTAKGAYYGLQTLTNLLKENQGILKTGCIQDAPRYAFRGFMLDVCRHFFSIDQVKRILDYCSALKLNYFHWHLSDDQGFRIESKRFPRLNTVGSWYIDDDQNRIGGYYTQEEILDVIAYAARRNIEIIPEIDLPGHSTAIVASYPDLSCQGEPIPVAKVPGIHSHILCGGDTAVQSFLFELLDEMTELFPGKYFHIGGDEAPKAEWIRCPKCQKKIRLEGLKDEEELQGFFTRQLNDYLKTKGRILIGWNEILKSDQVTGAVSQYYVESEATYCYDKLKNGQKFIFSNEYANYFDYVSTLVPLKAVYCYEPDIQGHKDIPKDQVLGLEAALWTEEIASMKEIERMIFPRLFAFAENAWTHQKDYDDFLTRARRYESLLKEAGISHTPIDQADYYGEDVPAQVAEAMCRHLFFLGRGVPLFVVQAFMRAIRQMVDNLRLFGYSEADLNRARDLVVAYLTGNEENE